MFSSIKNILKWRPLKKSAEENKWQPSLLLAAFVGILEDVLFWKKMWTSLVFILIMNIIFLFIVPFCLACILLRLFKCLLISISYIICDWLLLLPCHCVVCLHFNVNFVEFVIYLLIAIDAMDAFEAWLKYKHRTVCLKKLASNHGTKLSSAAVHLKEWMKLKWCEYIYLRETNHAKAFLMVNIILGIIFLLGKYISGYELMYIILMGICLFYKISKSIIKVVRKIHQNTESDGEFDGLIPEVSDVDFKILSIEPEIKHVVDDRQSLDYFKPDDIPIEDSDSSEHSSSLVTNMSMENMQAFEKEAEITDSSEDEYMPLVQQKQLQSTLEEVQPTESWSGAAYNALFNLAGAVSGMVNTSSDDNKRKRVFSVDSSDGFEMIDKNDLN